MEEEIIQHDTGHLEQRITELENIISALVFSDRYMFQRALQILDSRNIKFGTTVGTKIGTGTNQKMGFYNVTPIVQRSGAAQASVATTASTQTTPFGYSTAAQADAIVTLANELRAWAVAQGFIKGSA